MSLEECEQQLTAPLTPLPSSVVTSGVEAPIDSLTFGGLPGFRRSGAMLRCWSGSRRGAKICSRGTSVDCFVVGAVKTCKDESLDEKKVRRLFAAGADMAVESDSSDEYAGVSGYLWR